MDTGNRIISDYFGVKPPTPERYARIWTLTCGIFGIFDQHARRGGGCKMQGVHSHESRCLRGRQYNRLLFIPSTLSCVLGPARGHNFSLNTCNPNSSPVTLPTHFFFPLLRPSAMGPLKYKNETRKVVHFFFLFCMCWAMLCAGRVKGKKYRNETEVRGILAIQV